MTAIAKRSLVLFRLECVDDSRRNRQEMLPPLSEQAIGVPRDHGDALKAS